MKSTTLKLLAKKAGVGLATVDRVLNERGGVSPKMTRKVLDAAKESGLNRILPEERTSPWKIEVLLSINDSFFFKALTKSLGDMAESMGYRRLTLFKTYVSESNPKKMAQLITASRSRRDGIIVFSNEHTEISEAIRECVEHDFPVITIVTDLPESGSLCHVGIDHVQAGRTAAKLMGELIKEKEGGEVLLVSGRHDYRNHRQRIEAFQSFMAEKYPKITLVDVIRSEEDRHLITELLEKKLFKHKNIVGLYNTGLGNTQISQSLMRHKVNGKVVYICHELYETTQDLLKKDIINFTIDSNILQHTHQALNIMLNVLETNSRPVLSNESKVNFILYTSENI